uniref:Uncharacterized protein n=1 Tax=Heterorhabditis bacteriophora TaxID=37862 RepID=A0A1I7XAU7_HETBA
MTPSGQTALGCQKAPEAALHLETSKIIPHLLPKGRWEKSTEAKPRLKKTLNNGEKNSPINLHCSESSKLTFQVHRILPFAGSTVVCFTNSRNHHLSLLRTSTGSAQIQIISYYLLAEKTKNEPAEIGTVAPPLEHSHLPLGQDDLIMKA